MSVPGWLSTMVAYTAAVLLLVGRIPKFRDSSPTRATRKAAVILAPAAVMRLLGFSKRRLALNLVSPTPVSLTGTLYALFSLHLSYVLLRRLPFVCVLSSLYRLLRSQAKGREVRPAW